VNTSTAVGRGLFKTYSRVLTEGNAHRQKGQREHERDQRRGQGGPSECLEHRFEKLRKNHISAVRSPLKGEWVKEKKGFCTEKKRGEYTKEVENLSKHL